MNDLNATTDESAREAEGHEDDFWSGFDAEAVREAAAEEDREALRSRVPMVDDDEGAEEEAPEAEARAGVESTGGGEDGGGAEAPAGGSADDEAGTEAEDAGAREALTKELNDSYAEIGRLRGMLAEKQSRIDAAPAGDPEVEELEKEIASWQEVDEDGAKLMRKVLGFAKRQGERAMDVVDTRVGAHEVDERVEAIAERSRAAVDQAVGGRWWRDHLASGDMARWVGEQDYAMQRVWQSAASDPRAFQDAIHVARAYATDRGVGPGANGSGGNGAGRTATRRALQAQGSRSVRGESPTSGRGRNAGSGRRQMQDSFLDGYDLASRELEKEEGIPAYFRQ